MAELAYALAGKILEKLGSLADKEISLVLDIKSELTELEGTMTTIQAVLLDAEEKQATNRPLSIWLRQLKDIFYDADNVLDEVEYEVLKKQVMRTYGRTSREVCGLFSCCSAFAFRSQLGHKIKDIRQKLGKIAANKDQFNLIPRLEDRHVIHGRRRDMTHSFVPPSEVIGRNDDKENIIHLLIDPYADTNAINVIPIVGIGGLGKTTIAKLVYNEERVANHFDLKIWVCVSEDFDVTRLIKDILKSANGAIDEKLGVDLWQISLRNSLKNKKFLLILDDVWNEDRSKWVELKGLLSGGSIESRIVVTTRSRSVASMVGSGRTYTLEGLSHDDSLSLFVKWAFKEGEDKQYPNLLEIGKEIVKKCKGVPLAIRTLGSLLFSKVDELQYWKFVRDNEIWRLEQKEGDILPVLKLSYNPMPSHLKQCFAFCSLFPKDHEFDSNELIAFWMAHGLLNKTPNSQNLELEDVGDMYIKELLSKSFFQEVTDFTWFYKFKMHDLVHDLALKVAEEECLTTVDFHTQNIVGTILHLSFSHDDYGREVPKYFYTLSSGMRTTLFAVKQQVPTLAEACISRFKYLRVLDLTYSSFEVLSSSIGTLKHLRSLSLASNDKIKKLPDSICELYNLQTLLLHGCSSLERLPKDTKKMISLRYLTVTTTCTHLFENDVCSLSSLRILGIFVCPRLEVLFQGMVGSLTNLRRLVVAGCEKLTSLTLDNKHLTALETLVIFGCTELSFTGGEDNQDLNLSLQKLEITYVPKLEVLPQWLQGTANTLQYLRIAMCRNLTTLPEWLPSLNSLHTLKIFSCPKLSSLPEGIDRLTALKELRIEECNELIVRKCQEEYRSQIAHIPTVILRRPRLSSNIFAASMGRTLSFDEGEGAEL
ncbi:putative disease resistance protein RGA1 [Alnus glutinosa]|uniref:putative disease resistance protein RGA1 n=1 Tax=Alnus glutinosa TaxID=3517 RepID=UPI002D78BC19|nr:putative disease resistance protein RGA1 [Alnus glutinosa]